MALDASFFDASSPDTSSPDTSSPDTSSLDTRSPRSRLGSWLRPGSRSESSKRLTPRRVAKLGLCGIVLVGVVGGSLGLMHPDKTVLVRVDGQVRKVHTSAADVRGALASAKLSVGPHDLLAPDLGARVRGGSEIVLSRGHLLNLSVDGSNRSLWVNATSVDEALSQLGFTSNAFVSVSRSKRLNDGATDLSIYRPKKVTFHVDGRSFVVLSSGPTIADAVSDAGIRIGSNDRMSVSAAVPLRNGQSVTIQRVRYGQDVQTVTVPFDTVSKPDPTTYSGTKSVTTAGQVGQSQITYSLVYVDGQLSGRVVTDTTVISEPVDQVTSLGSKKLPPVVPAGVSQQIAAGLIAQRGWDNTQFSCLVSLWGKESGWRTNAANPSGAYGIPQALPGSKMSSAGSDWQTNPTTQITWGLNYIAGVYGTPCGAWGHSQAYNWY